MRKTALSIALAGALSLPAVAAAQYAEIHLTLPEVLPPMVVIEAGVQVIPEIGHEVFLVNGVYYTRNQDRWYRADDVRAGAWMGVAPQAVPVALVKIPPGKYKYWKPTKAEKEQAKAEKKAAKKAKKGNGKH